MIGDSYGDGNVYRGVRSRDSEEAETLHVFVQEVTMHPNTCKTCRFLFIHDEWQFSGSTLEGIGLCRRNAPVRDMRPPEHWRGQHVPGLALWPTVVFAEHWCGEWEARRGEMQQKGGE